VVSQRLGLKSPYLLLSALLASEALLVTGYGLQLMLLPVRGSMVGFTSVDLGLLGAAYYCGFVIGCLIAPILLSRVGHTRTFAALVAITAGAVVCYPILVQPQFWALLRFITGICLAGLYLIIESWINDKASTATRGTMISIYVAINYIATAAGQLLITLHDASSFVLFSIAALIIGLAIVPLTLSRSPEPNPPEMVRVRPLKLIKLSPVGSISIFLVSLSTGALWSLGPVLALAKTGDLSAAAQFMSIVVIGGAIAQWPIGKLSDRVDRRFVLMGITLAATLASVVLALVPNTTGSGLLIALLFGATILPSYAIAAAHVYDVADKGEYVQVAASLLLVFGIGSTLGPLFASVGMEWFGPNALVWFMGLAQISASALVFVRMRLNMLQKVREKQSFDMSTAAAVAPAGLATPQTDTLPASDDTTDTAAPKDSGNGEINGRAS
jgi:MFS family permease